MDYVFWLQIVLFIILMGFSGFFSSSETSLFSLNNIQLEQMRRDGNPRIGLIERLLSQPRRLIQTILIGNEFVNVAASVISASLIIQLMGAENKWMNLFVMIPILLLVGEITPKTLAIRNNVAFATAQSVPIDWFSRIMTPVRWVVRAVSEFFITLIVGKERSRGNLVTEDMVRTLAREAVGEGALDKQEAQFIEQIFDFGNKTVADVMTPRSNIFFLPADLSVAEMATEMRRTLHPKVPVYREHRDTIVGILYARDLIGVPVEDTPNTPENLEKILREPFYVPESKHLADLFHIFRKRKLSMALSVDEYGGITGLVTMEDLLECIFGKITSRSETKKKAAHKMEELSEGVYRAEGTLRIDHLNEALEVELDSHGVETLGGLLLESYGELPPVGTIIDIDPLRFTVTATGIKRNRIKEVKIEYLEKKRPTAPPAEADEADVETNLKTKKEVEA
jgi:putative hemolysin